MKKRYCFSLVLLVLIVAGAFVLLQLEQKHAVSEHHSIPPGTGENETHQEQIGGPLPFPMHLAEKFNLDELSVWTENVGWKLCLPTWMPGNIAITAINYKSPVLMITCSDRGVTDYRYDNVTIEVVEGEVGPPLLEEWKEIASRSGSDLLMVGGIWASVKENAPWGWPELQKLYGPSPYAYFWREGLYYSISATNTISKDQVIRIIESMRPVVG